MVTSASTQVLTRCAASWLTHLAPVFDDDVLCRSECGWSASGMPSFHAQGAAATSRSALTPLRKLR